MRNSLFALAALASMGALTTGANSSVLPQPTTAGGVAAPSNVETVHYYGRRYYGHRHYRGYGYGGYPYYGGVGLGVPGFGFYLGNPGYGYGYRRRYYRGW